MLLPLVVNVAYSMTGGTAIFLPGRTYVGGEQYGRLLDCADFLDQLRLDSRQAAIAGRVVALTRQWLDAPGLSVADIFSRRTIAGLAGRLTELGGERAEFVAQTFLDVLQLTDEQVEAEIARG